MTVADTTVTLTDSELAALKAAGVTGFSRYLCPVGLPKRIQPAEFARIRTAGMDLVLNWENYADDWTRAGMDPVATAIEAVRQARAMPDPDFRVIYYSVDQDITAAQWPTVRDRLLRGPNTVHGAATTGLYASTDVINWAVRDGVAAWFWQSMSTGFSAGRNKTLNPHTNIWQRRGTILAGVDLDLSDIIRPDWGQYGYQQSGDIQMMIATDGTNYYLCDGMRSRPVDPAHLKDLVYLASQGLMNLAKGPGNTAEWTQGGLVRVGWTEANYGALAPAQAAGAALTDTDRTLLDETRAEVHDLNGRLSAAGATPAA